MHINFFPRARLEIETILVAYAPLILSVQLQNIFRSNILHLVRVHIIVEVRSVLISLKTFIVL